MSTRWEAAVGCNTLCAASASVRPEALESDQPPPSPPPTQGWPAAAAASLPTCLRVQQDVIRDALYWEAYERAKLAAREAQRRAAKAREDAADALAVDGGEGDWQVGRWCLVCVCVCHAHTQSVARVV